MRSLLALTLAPALALAAAAPPAGALPPPRRVCTTETAAGASARVVVQPAGTAPCPLARRVVGTWLRHHRTRIGPWRCARFPHVREQVIDHVAACDFGKKSTIFIERRRRTCRVLYRGPEPPVRVEMWGVRHTRCGAAARLVRAFLDDPRVHRGGWTCHVPGPAQFARSDYAVGCRRGPDAGVYGIDTY